MPSSGASSGDRCDPSRERRTSRRSGYPVAPPPCSAVERSSAKPSTAIVSASSERDLPIQPRVHVTVSFVAATITRQGACFRTKSTVSPKIARLPDGEPHAPGPAHDDDLRAAACRLVDDRPARVARAHDALCDAHAVELADRARLVELLVRLRELLGQVRVERQLERHLDHGLGDDRSHGARPRAGRRPASPRPTGSPARSARGCSGTRGCPP